MKIHPPSVCRRIGFLSGVFACVVACNHLVVAQETGITAADIERGKAAARAALEAADRNGDDKANFTRRAGINSSVLSPGDRVTLIGWPGRPGQTRERLMRLMRAEFPNGDVATFTAISATFTRAESK